MVNHFFGLSLRNPPNLLALIPGTVEWKMRRRMDRLGEHYLRLRVVARARRVRNVVREVFARKG
jgi:hypothetical protein